MRTFPDGRLAVWDQGNLRISVFDAYGVFIEHHVIKSYAFAFYSTDEIFEVDHNGNFYILKPPRESQNMRQEQFGWLRISPAGELLDTIEVPPDREARPQTFVLFTASGDAHPVVEWPRTRMSPLGYLITGRNDEYSFRLNISNSPPIKIEREFTPVKITPEEREQWETWVANYNTNNVIPEFKPPYKQILTDRQGRIWVWRYVVAVYTEENIGPQNGPESHWWEPPTFDVFLPDGTYHATVILPLNAEFKDSQDDRVWAVLEGEYDEQYVARFRLVEQKN